MLQTAMKYMPNRMMTFLTASYFKAAAFKQNGFRKMHSVPITIQRNNIFIQVIPALKDNYMYLVGDMGTMEALAIDPVDVAEMDMAITKGAFKLLAILNTHCHWDHTGGNEKLIEKYPGIKVYGGDRRIPGLTQKVGHGYTFALGCVAIECLATPCHTTGDICYRIEDGQGGSLFTGDTLFIGGCGRFFEGTAAQMYRALIEVIGNLPDETSIFCGHEYTKQNLLFAKTVEPENQDILKKLEWANAQRNSDMPTVPTKLSEEKKYNPFMRVHASTVQKHVSCSEPIATMKKLREKKDAFKV